MDEEEGNSPERDHDDHNIDNLCKAARLEEALIEQEDRDFYAGNGDDIEELEGKERLHNA